MIIVVGVATKPFLTEITIFVQRFLLMTLEVSLISELFRTNSTLSRIHTMNHSLMVVVIIKVAKLQITGGAIFDAGIL